MTEVVADIEGETASSSTSFVGTGRMGAALAGTVIAAGQDVTVWNRTPGRSQELLDRGASGAATVREAAAASDTTVVCVSDYAATRGLIEVDEVADALRGKTLVQLTTGSPAEARAAADWAERHGIAYVEGYPQVYHNQIGTDESVVVYSGPRAAYDPIAPTLERFGATVFLGEPIGLAKAACAASLPLYQGSILGLLQGAAYAEAEGLELRHYRDMMVAFADTVRTMAIGVCERLESGVTEPPQSSVANQIGASEMMLAASHDSQTSALLPAFVNALLGRAGKDGLGYVDVAAMIDYFRRPDPELEQRVLDATSASLSG